MSTEQVLFALIGSVVCGKTISDETKAACIPEMLERVHTLAAKHDLAHLVGQAISKMALPQKEELKKYKGAAMSAFVRHMQLDYEFVRTCQALEEAKIPFMPLKGSVLRAYYPEPWMRTSCDADILVHPEDLEKAISILTEKLSYAVTERATHDVTLFCPAGPHIELHFDLVEEGRANAAAQVLCRVWEEASCKEGQDCWYEMSDAFFYFYHIAHMAKHFETGGCGIRPFIDLWLLDNGVKYVPEQRDALLETGGLLQFAEAARKLSRVWFDGEETDGLSQRLEKFLLYGGAYGSTDNRVALQQENRGGKLGYLLSRIFAPYEKLKSYYPILEKHRYLMPVMQVRRWFMLLRPEVARMAKSELSASSATDSTAVNVAGNLLKDLGLHTTTW